MKQANLERLEEILTQLEEMGDELEEMSNEESEIAYELSDIDANHLGTARSLLRNLIYVE